MRNPGAGTIVRPRGPSTRTLGLEMKKLTLNLDELQVDSFEITQRIQRDGTVRAHLWAWSDESVCPTTAPSERRPCY